MIEPMNAIVTNNIVCHLCCFLLSRARKALHVNTAIIQVFLIVKFYLNQAHFRLNIFMIVYYILVIHQRLVLVCQYQNDLSPVPIRYFWTDL